MTRKPTIGMAVLLLLAVVSGISMASAADVCRDLPSETQAPGTTMAVGLVITLDGADTYMIEDSVPTGWTITDAPGGSISSDGSMVSYSALGGGSDTTCTYQVAIPSGTPPGTHDFTGQFGIGTGDMGPITCGNMSVVVSGEPVAANVCRDLPSGNQTPGTTISVGLVITLGGADTYMIEDYVPTGWTITAAPGGSISDDLRMVSYSAIGGGSDTTLTYQVEIPSGTSPGTHDFTGQFGIGTGDMGPITCGDMSVDVVSGEPSAADVCRGLPSETQTPGTTISVDLVITLDGADTYMIEDSVPTGWTITDAPGGSISSDGSMVSYSALGGGSDTTLTYQVEIPSGTSPGTYGFTGQFGIGTGGMVPITCGDMGVDVSGESVAADVCRDLPSGDQAPGATISVDLVITLGGADTYMIEDSVPTGWTITAAPGGSISNDSSMVSYSALGGGSDTTLTYQVEIPSGTSPETYDFTGQFGIGTGDMGPITCGDMSVVVIDNDAPTVDLIYPTGGELSGEVTLNASATDSDGSIVSVVFYYSGDDGSTWAEIGAGASASGYYTCAWDTAEVDNGDYNVMAVATDNDGATGEDISDAFTIDNGFCLTLDAGWNMVSIPKKISSSSSNAAPEVFNIVGGETCDSYNGCAEEWSSNWEVNVVPCRGYFVYKLAPETICMDLEIGNSAPPSQQLCTGWNLVGHVDTSERSVEEFASMTTLGDKIAQVWYRTSNGIWIGYPYWTLDTMTPGDGYWLLMSEDGMMYGTP